MSATVEAVRERPILFSGPMVRAILDRRKTQTRRVILPQPADYVEAMRDVPSTCLWWPAQIVNGDLGTMYERVGHEPPSWRCPYGYAGDLLWVRETWLPDPPLNGWSGDIEWDGCGRAIASVPREYRSPEFCAYAEGWAGETVLWKPSIHMPRWACRLMLRVTAVRVERVQDISEADAEAEGLTKRGEWWDVGADWTGDGLDTTASGAFRMRWDALNAKRGYGWDANPWVWAISFERVATQPGGAA